MENIKPVRNQASRLGVAVSLCESNRLTLRKESNFLCRPKKLTRFLVSKSSLVKASKLFLPRKNKTYFNSLIDWDFGTENNDFSDVNTVKMSDLIPQTDATNYLSELRTEIKVDNSNEVSYISPTVNFVDNDNLIQNHKKTPIKSRKKAKIKSKTKNKITSKKSKAIAQSKILEPVFPQTIDETSPVVTTNIEQPTSPQTPVVPTNVEQSTSPQIPVVPTNLEQPTSPQIPVVNLNELTQTTSEISPVFEPTTQQSQSTSFQ
ncbi:MAG: hypothetical protein WBF90_30965, partial [Rivularia sp. (in: cyanobacteria)]